MIVLFGATGDLAKRKLLPGMFHLPQVGLMPERFRIIGAARQRLERRGVPRARARGGRRLGPRGRSTREAWDRFAESLRFAGVGDGFEPLGEASRRGARGARRRRRASSSTSRCRPAATEARSSELGAAGLGEGARVITEKPFGTDLDSARKLNAPLHSVFDERCIFRIDHYLGREAVQNLLALRFANGMFEPVWNRNHIDHVQIDVPETLSIEMRGSFYEETGAFRDMIVTHLFQVLGFVAMEPPTSLEPKALGLEREKVFDSMPPLRPEDVVRGQYEGYREEDGVAAGLRHRDLRRRQGLRRQLALGGGALLPALGQAAGREPAPADGRLHSSRRGGCSRSTATRSPSPSATTTSPSSSATPAASPPPSWPRCRARRIAARRGPHALQLRRHLRRHRRRRSTPTSA